MEHITYAIHISNIWPNHIQYTYSLKPCSYTSMSDQFVYEHCILLFSSIAFHTELLQMGTKLITHYITLNPS